MRFHMGVSFSWRTLKKLIIPILLGALAYFGFSGIFDNFDFPLGFMRYIRVHALENYDTTYTIDFPDRHFFDLKIDDNITFTEFVDHLNTIESEYYNIIVSPSVSLEANSNYLYGFTIHTIPKSYSFLNFSFFGQSLSFSYYNDSINWTYYYLFDLYKDNPSDIYSYSKYLELLDCLENNHCINKNSDVGISHSYGRFYPNSTNDTSSVVELFANHPNFNGSTYLSPGFIYYSNVPIVYNNTYNVNSSNYFYKKLIINGSVLNVGDYFPTYYEYLQTLPPEEENTPSDETNHKKLFSKIFWLDDSNTEKGILSSIYILLFLYCLTMILFKIATLLKNKRW